MFLENVPKTAVKFGLKKKESYIKMCKNHFPIWDMLKWVVMSFFLGIITSLVSKYSYFCVMVHILKKFAMLYLIFFTRPEAEPAYMYVA